MIRNTDKNFKEALEKQHECYILITCDHPTPDGEMNVEMSYEGDPILASYLLQQALSNIESQINDEEYMNN